MNKGTILNVGRLYKSRCNFCQAEKIDVGIGPNGKGYILAAHIDLRKRDQRPGDRCDGSETQIDEVELQRLALLWP